VLLLCFGSGVFMVVGGGSWFPVVIGGD